MDGRLEYSSSLRLCSQKTELQALNFSTERNDTWTEGSIVQNKAAFRLPYCIDGLCTASGDPGKMNLLFIKNVAHLPNFMAFH